MRKDQVLIKIGHGAYGGINKMRMCFSKAQAVRILRIRGFTRDEARNAVNRALERDWSGTTLSNASGVVEITNQRYSFLQGYFWHKSYEDIKNYWKNVPEE